MNAKLLRRAVLVSVAAFAVLSIAGDPLHGQAALLGPPDAVFHNGKVVTVDAGFTVQQAFAIKNGRFAAVGASGEMLALAGPKTRVVDLQGRTILPGLSDSHNHQYRAASTMLRGIDVTGVRSLSQMMRRIAAAAKVAAPGAPIVIAAGWQPRDLSEKRGPTRRELDEAARSHPVIVIRTRSQVFLNTAALQVAGVTRQTAAVAGVPIPKGPDGEPTGVIDEPAAVTEVTNKLLPKLADEEKRALILRMQERQHEVGLTSIRELSLSPDILRLYWDLWRSGKLTLRVSMGLEAQASDADRLDAMLQFSGVGPGFGDDWLRLDCVGEFGLDSGIAEAFVRKPLVGEHAHPQGIARITREALERAVLVMHKYGWRPSIHIVGDGALDLALDAYEAADRVAPIRPRRWIVEHVEVVQPDQMERMARLGVLVSAQIQPYQDSVEMRREWGPERADRSVAIREFLDHGVIVGSGTDFPARSNNPFVTMGFYVTRKTLEGTTLGLAEKISREEALRLATINNAYLTFEEASKGSIEPNKLADFLVLSGDFLTVPEKDIAALYPVATYVGGRRVFAKSEGQSY